jgi:inosose dehydratase
VKLAFSRPTADAEEQHRLFSWFRTAGYDGLQLKHVQYAGYVERPESFLEEWGHHPGVASGLIAGGTLDEAGVASLRNLFDFARAVGTRLIVFCHSLSREGLSSEEIRGFGRTLSELGKEAQQLGVKLSLHHHYDQPVMYREDFDAFFEVVEDGSVGLTVDTAHLVKSGNEDIAGLIRDFRQVIDNFHLKDFAGGRFEPLGQGEIDFAPVFSAIREIGYEGWLCADEESGGDIIGTMDLSHRFIKSGLSARGA